MSDDEVREGPPNSSSASAAEGYSARVLAREQGVTVARAQRLIREHGNQRSVLDPVVEALKSAGVLDKDHARPTVSDRARATDEHVKPLLEKALGDMRSKTERLRQERLAQLSLQPNKKMRATEKTSDASCGGYHPSGATSDHFRQTSLSPCWRRSQT